MSAAEILRMPVGDVTLAARAAAHARNAHACIFGLSKIGLILHFRGGKMRQDRKGRHEINSG